MSKHKFVGVNENNEVIGPITEEECLRGNLHRSVTVAVFNDKGEIAIQKRSKNRKLYPGMLTLSATGHVDWTGEAPESDEIAAKREFEEELGKPASKDLEYKFTTHLNAPGHNIMSAVFTTEDNGPFNPDPEELESLNFMTPEEIQKNGEKFTPTAKLNLHKLGIIK